MNTRYPFGASHCAAVLSAVCFLCASPAFARQWQLSNVGTGRQPAIALSPGGAPCIAGYSSGYLHYYSQTRTGWSNQTVASAATDGTLRCTLAYDSSGSPCIAYTAGSYGSRTLNYARYNGSAWDVQTVDASGNTGYCASMVLDGSSRPHMSYRDALNNSMKHAWYDGTSWKTEVIEHFASGSPIAEYESSIALDSSGAPGVTYGSKDWTDLRYARKTSTGWNLQTVESGNGAGVLSTLRYDASGAPCIGYLTLAGNQVKLARLSGTTWTKQVVDSLSNNTTGVDFTLDAQGRAHFLYFDYLGQKMLYATQSGGVWTHETVGSATGGADFGDITVSSSGLVQVCYSSATTVWYGALVPEPNTSLALVFGLGGMSCACIRWRRRPE